MCRCSVNSLPKWIRTVMVVSMRARCSYTFAVAKRNCNNNNSNNSNNSNWGTSTAPLPAAEIR